MWVDTQPQAYVRMQGEVEETVNQKSDIKNVGHFGKERHIGRLVEDARAGAPVRTNNAKLHPRHF